MKAILSVLISIAVAAAIGCSGGRHISMKNTTGQPVKITFTLNDDSLSENPFLLYNSEELTFNLASPKTSHIKLTFGDGGWSPKEVEKLVGFLKSIEITSSTQKIKLETIPRMKDYLLARRRGLSGSRIEILASK